MVGKEHSEGVRELPRDAQLYTPLYITKKVKTLS